MTPICRASRADAALTLAIISDVALFVLTVLLLLLLFNIPPPRFVTANIAVIATPILLILSILTLAILGSGCIEALSDARLAEETPRLIARSAYAFSTGIKTVVLMLFALVLVIVHVILRRSFFFKKHVDEEREREREPASPRYSSPEYDRERGRSGRSARRTGETRTGTASPRTEERRVRRS